MDTEKKNDPAEELRKLINAWNHIGVKEGKMTNIVKFICTNYNEKADNDWLKQISEHPRLLSELFEKKEDGSFKYSKGIKIVIGDKTLEESNINDILGKIEKKELNLGYEFLLNKDEKHKKLLQILNGLLYDQINDPWQYNNQDKIANFAQEHYNTFIAAMQNGLPVHRFGQLKNKNENAFLNIIKQADEKGMILAQYNNKAYLINTKDEHNKTLNLIDKNQIKKIVVTAHPYMNYDDFDEVGSQEKESNTLYLYPLNDKFLSFISSRQTEGVENTCKIINYFTNNQRMNVTLEGGSQGVDFITKMVGSTHGKKNRIKNAEITLNINKPHLFQDEYKIFQRLRNTDNSNNIAKISFGNSTYNCLHPICKKNELKALLNYYKQKGLLKVNEIVDLTDAGPNQQNTLN